MVGTIPLNHKVAASMRPWTFVHLTDIHVGSPKSFRFAPAFNENWQTARRQILKIKPDLVLVGGDVTRDGYYHRFELEAIKADLDTLPFPYHIVAGNSDVGDKFTDVSGSYGDRNDVELNIQSVSLQRFASVFGPLCWSFLHEGVRFSGFCSMIAGSGLPEEDDLWVWMESLRNLPPADHHVWLMHYPLFIDHPHEPNFDIRDPKQYLHWYFGMDEPSRSRILAMIRATGPSTVISGHIHCRRHQFLEGIRFDKAPSTAFSQWEHQWPDGDPTLGFLRYDFNGEGITCTFVPLESLSTTKGDEAGEKERGWEQEKLP